MSKCIELVLGHSLALLDTEAVLLLQSYFVEAPLAKLLAKFFKSEKSKLSDLTVAKARTNH